MALKKVKVLLGQSNQEGVASKLLLPASLRGVQANTYIFNYENNARELLNCDGAGANLPNNNTVHFAGFVGPEMQLAAAAVAEYGEIDLFKFAVVGTAMGPIAGSRSWNVEDADLFTEFVTRWTAYVALMNGLGHTIDVIDVNWLQGESDAGTEGNDEAYYGFYKRFIRQVRAVLQPYTTSEIIPWITGLIHSGVGNTNYSRLQNVRAALARAGWSDPTYRIVDLNRFSFLGDNLHLDTNGVVACGQAFWDASQLTYNNSMPLEDYSLGSLRTRLSEEFGIDLNVAANNSALDRRINDAIAWVVNRRKNWPWLERDTVIDIGELDESLDSSDRYGSALFTKNRITATYCSFNLTAISAREMIDFVGSGMTGLLAVSYGGSTIQLKSRYRGDQQLCTITGVTAGNPTIIKVSLSTYDGGTAVIPSHVPTFQVSLASTATTTPVGNFDGTYVATRVSDSEFSIPYNSTTTGPTATGFAQIAREFRIAQAYFELPDDFIRSIAMNIDEDTEDNLIKYKTPTLYEREIRNDRVASNLNRIYTVVPDPLNTSSRKFAAFYPYFTSKHTLYAKYYGDAKKLVADDDVSDIPRSDRLVVLYAAGWFVAQWQKDNDLVAFYRDGALGELEKMTKEHQFSDDSTEGFDDAGDPLDPIRGPSGFPRFEE